MSMCNCHRCGKVIVSEIDSLCLSCFEEEEKEFKRIKEFLIENPLATVFQVSVSLDDSLQKFKDVDDSHWASEAILEMSEKDIIAGYPDSTFKPNSIVNRGEFAKMMVKALELEIIKPASPTFKDVNTDNWVYPYAESAKYYLTGFRTSSGDYFRPSRPATRKIIPSQVLTLKMIIKPNYKLLERLMKVR